jgi:hypothetical protein
MLFTGLVILFALAWVTTFTYAKVSGRSIQYTRMAACGLLELGGSADDCSDASGGLEISHAADIKDVDIDNAVLDLEGRIVDIPWVTIASPYVSLTPDDNDQALFNQESTRDDNGKINVVHTATYSFTGLNDAKVQAARYIKSCCALIVVHVLNNTFVFVQGVAARKINGTWVLKRTKKAAKANPSLLSDTGENSDRVTLDIISQDKEFAATLTSGQEAPDPVIAAATWQDLVVTD